jgi:hypothetical protein
MLGVAFIKNGVSAEEVPAWGSLARFGCEDLE